MKLLVVSLKTLKKKKKNKKIIIETEEQFYKKITEKYGLKFPKRIGFYHLREYIYNITDKWKEITFAHLDRFIILNEYNNTKKTDETRRIRLLNRAININRNLNRFIFKGEKYNADNDTITLRKHSNSRYTKNTNDTKTLKKDDNGCQLSLSMSY